MGLDSESGQIGKSRQTPRSESDPVFETHYDYSSQSDSLTVVIIDAIADEMGVSPTEVVPKISDAVDPDALERILRPLPDGTQRNGRLTFSLLEYDITIESDGTILIHDTTA